MPALNIESTVLYSTWGWLGVIVGAAFLIGAAAVLTHVLVRFVSRIILAASDGRVAGSILNNILRVTIWVIAIALVLRLCLGIDPTPLWGALGVGGIALSLGAQSTISNLIGGLLVTLSKDTTVGDWVVVGGIEGEVKDITWRKMLVQDELGNVHNIPNSTLTTSTVTVLTKYFSVVLPLVLDSGCDLVKIDAELPGIVSRALVANGMQYEGKPPVFTVSGTDSFGISCTLRCYAKRSFGTGQVTKTAMEASIGYLSEHGALASKK